MPEPNTKSHSSEKASRTLRIDPIEIDPSSFWMAMTQSPGVGVSITDAEGRLLFVNDTAMVFFSESTGIDYQGKCIHDFHSAEFAEERLSIIHRVLDEEKPLAMCHVYHGHRIHSTIWPIRDRKPPYNRVVVVSRSLSGHDLAAIPESAEMVETRYIDLGPLNALTQRETEVAVLLGHGLSVPKVAELLHRSPKTIERHKSAISEKLKLHGQAELVVVVTEMGLDLDDTKLKRLPTSTSEATDTVRRQ